jgi:hypothetical protein
MATNPYFSQGSTSEQLLYEDLIVESLKMYGQDVYYLPRELVNVDVVFGDDVPSRFENAYQIEMYIDTIEGFEGEGDLFTKFGVEIRDTATFTVARRRWNSVVSPFEQTDDRPFYRPREGDLIFLPLSGSIFEITKVEDESPFYQLKNLPVFRMTCELFEYSDEDFDTGIDGIDNVEVAFAYQTELVFDSITGSFEVGETIRQVDPQYNMDGEIVKIDLSDSNNLKVYVAHYGASDGVFHSWSTSMVSTGLTSGAFGTPKSINEIQNIDKNSQNDVFDTESLNIIDFSESNPFGDPL